MGILEIFRAKNKIKLDRVFAGFFKESFDAVAVVDNDFNIIENNKEFGDLFGHNLSIRNLFKEDKNSTTLDEEQRFISFWESTTSIGFVKDVSLRASDDMMRIGDLKLLKKNNGWLFIFRNTLQFKERENKLKMVAQADKLTGLLNRQGLVERLGSAISAQKEGSQFKVGVLFLDLDDFKPINDTFGHDAGDEILRHVADAMTSILPDYAAISRMGGDEFVCMISACESKSELRQYGESIIAAVAREVVVAGGDVVSVQCSVGGAIFPEDATDYIQDSNDLVGAILKASDVAMYHAKKSGKNKVFIKNA
ncbi:GGDEF domain-containing protein [Photobacterium damselae]|uniref:GGDEF domain-containing protein n=1 Tax=Photobacterium damselae TaxID=38293 RepID=UPI001F16C772|nr:GGDEF domain-containing protein [Photobacterium damselae]UKA04653.1 GGDEF domain-containing protein [Photobacterium damselae subsp. damselae]